MHVVERVVSMHWLGLHSVVFGFNAASSRACSLSFVFFSPLRAHAWKWADCHKLAISAKVSAHLYT